jgi:hypothetical protein
MTKDQLIKAAWWDGWRAGVKTSQSMVNSDLPEAELKALAEETAAKELLKTLNKFKEVSLDE